MKPRVASPSTSKAQKRSITADIFFSAGRKKNARAMPNLCRHCFGAGTPDGIGRAPRGINDGKGFVFISHPGEVFPSAFLPVSAGNVRKQSLTALPAFAAIRGAARQFKPEGQVWDL